MGWWIGLYVMAAFYVLAGINHFRAPDFYRPMMPPYIPFHDFCIYVSGGAEIVLGLGLLHPLTRAFAAWGIEAMLTVFLTVHVYMLQERAGKFASVPAWVLWARLPGQAFLMAWALVYTKFMAR
jgi:uncharacterized membrane protein